jgi:hypothetical protein
MTTRENLSLFGQTCHTALRFVSGPLAFAFLTATLTGLARANAACAQRRETVAEARVEVQSPGTGRCWLTIDPDWAPSFKYRSYLFDEKGFFMVFNSTGRGPESETTGAREFYLFPRKKGLDYKISGEQIDVLLPSGAVLKYNARTLRWIGAKGGTIQEAEEISHDNQGGVEIRLESGVLLDFGFKLGGAPTGDRDGRAVFVDASGKRCEVKNSEVLKFSSSGESSLRFKTDREVQAFLKAKCPELKFNL